MGSMKHKMTSTAQQSHAAHQPPTSAAIYNSNNHKMSEPAQLSTRNNQAHNGMTVTGTHSQFTT